MRPQVVSVTGVGTSQPIILDNYISPFNIGFGAVITGSPTYKIEHTFDNVLTNSSPTWFPHPTVVNATVNQDGNYAFPVFAIRINITAVSTSGTVQLTAIQAGVA